MATNSVTLNNGIIIPSIGYGTWQTADGEIAVNCVKSAIEAGYTHLDTAAIYGNEKSVGHAIKESGVDRSKLFVTSKLWNTERGYDKAMTAFDLTLNNLQLDYLDLYLIHWPANAKQFSNWKEINAETWKALEVLYKAGRIKAIGTSNFLRPYLEALLESADVKPAVNQIEFHPGFRQEETVAFSKANNIAVEAWSPLGTGKMIDNELLKSIAGGYNKSVAQLCIRWVLQNGVIPLPKSTNAGRIKENLEVFDFEIREEDMQTINGMEYFGGSGLNPDEVGF